MDTQARIDAVLEVRRRRSEVLATMHGALDELRDALEHIAEAARDVSANAEDAVARASDDIARSATTLRSQVDVDQASLGSVRLRIDRDELVVGVVGQARMGKSRFLQSLTGLGPEEIPDSSGGFCTGVKSVIRPGPARSARVAFRSESTYTALLERYGAELSLGELRVAVRSQRLATVQPPAGATAEVLEKFRHVNGYLSALARHRDLLGMEPRYIDPAAVVDWVTQTDSTGAPQERYRMVEHVDIEVPFANGLRNLVVVDLPGIGDTNIDDVKRMTDAAEGEMDVAVIVRMPRALGDDWTSTDNTMYVNLSQAVPEVPMGLRTFILLNHTMHPDNEAQCRSFARSAKDRGLAVADVAIVDASSTEGVSALFDNVLDHLVEHVDEIDRAVLTSRLSALVSTAQAAVRLGDRLDEILGLEAEASPQHAARLIALTDETLGALALNLTECVARFDADRDDPDVPLEAEIAAVVTRARADKGLPTPDAIREMRAVEGGWPQVYGKLLNASRTHLAGHFVDLEPALDVSVGQMKSEIVRVLRKHGRLDPLASASGDQWLRDAQDRLQYAIGPGSSIARAFVTLADARLTYRGFLQHQIRPLLDGFDPDQPSNPLPQGGRTPQDIIDLVEATYDDALGRVDLLLRTEVVTAPSKARFALAEEFLDNALRGGRAGAEWRIIYLQYKNIIWPAEWAALTADLAQVRQWSESTLAYQQTVKRASKTLEAAVGNL